VQPKAATSSAVFKMKRWKVMELRHERVVKVVGKSANAAVNRIRIPALFELDAVGFDRSGREEVFYVDV